MKIPVQGLASALEKNLLPAYMIHGDEPLQRQEAANAIRQAALAAGYADQQRFYIEKGFNWSELEMSSSSMSLFAEKKVIELRVGSGKIGNGGKHLLAWAGQPPQECLLLIIGDRFERAVLQSGWYQALARISGIVEARPLDQRALAGWLSARLSHAGLRGDREAVETLADLVEGNLLAAVQEIEKMVLLYGEGAELDRGKVLAAVSDSARFDLFDLSRALQRNDISHYLRVLSGLREEGAEPTLVLWLLSREIRQFSGRQAGSRPQWLKRAAQLDRTIKGIGEGDVWQQFAELGLAICGRRTLG
ncbi:MAG TPA: DNA polymerase III subunit delta [Gammaproteobacteria bacterium]|nr:DNA polymerase III subunit delta [Gammaproteobacteria bacterium]